MAGPLPMSLVNWVLCSLMPEEGRERWGQGDREPELPFLLLCLFSLQSSPQCPDPRGCCSKGSYSWNSAWESCEQDPCQAQGHLWTAERSSTLSLTNCVTLGKPLYLP